jgi:hypothetical protein
MTNATANPNGWDFFFPSPHATQDIDLLRDLPLVPGLKEFLMLRQVHALEHGTVWVLSQMSNLNIDSDSIGGLSTDQGFYLYGNLDPILLRRAALAALRRFREGEWDLAVHPRCGTNLSVNMLLTTGLMMGMHLVLPKNPLSQLLGVGAAATTAASLAPDLGSWVQRYITTAVPFNLDLVKVSPSADLWGREALFVQVRWLG